MSVLGSTISGLPASALLNFLRRKGEDEGARHESPSPPPELLALEESPEESLPEKLEVAPRGWAASMPKV